MDTLRSLCLYMWAFKKWSSEVVWIGDFKFLLSSEISSNCIVRKSCILPSIITHLKQSEIIICSLDSVQFSHSVVSDSLRPHELQQARAPCPSPTPGVNPNSCPLRRWCHPAISSSVIPFSSCPYSLPASESFPMSQLFAWGGQSIGVSGFSIIPSKEHPGLMSFRMDWLDLLAVQGTVAHCGTELTPHWDHRLGLQTPLLSIINR